ncbi:MAG TPA: ATP synthase F1 subunit delta [Syntrophobacteraceae bacterium]|nr:ATP synthase F1 subunit delta [Syntrophobacteraceae bacterium]
MKNLVIAKRYAKALMSLAQADQAVESYGLELDQLLHLIGEQPTLGDVLQNPLYPMAARKSLFQSVAKAAGISPVMTSFVNLLIEKKRVQHLPEIAQYYRKLMDEHANIARAKLAAATVLAEDTIGQIAQTLEKLTGKKVIVEFEHDPALIGGVTAQIGDMVLDGSVRRQLLNFKETLKRGAVG